MGFLLPIGPTPILIAPSPLCLLSPSEGEGMTFFRQCYFALAYVSAKVLISSGFRSEIAQNVIPALSQCKRL